MKKVVPMRLTTIAMRLLLGCCCFSFSTSAVWAQPCREQLGALRASLRNPIGVPDGERRVIGFTLVTVASPRPDPFLMIQRINRNTVIPDDPAEAEFRRGTLGSHRGALVGHAVGTLREVLFAVRVGGTAPPPTDDFTLAGDAGQVFNDRRYATSPEGSFDPLRNDWINLQVRPTGQVTVSSVSWGNTEQRFTATCNQRDMWTGTILAPIGRYS
jgi:hypothetical protein